MHSPNFLEDEISIVAGKKVVLEYLTNAPQKIDVVLLLDKMKKVTPQIIKTCNQKKVKYQFVPQEKISRITNQRHQGVVARIFAPGYLDEYEVLEKLRCAHLKLLLAFDQIQDSGNVGTLTRTLYSLSGAGIVITKNRMASLGDRVATSSAGTIGDIPVARVTNLARFLRQCQEVNLTIYFAGTDHNCIDLYRSCLNMPAVLVLGNENQGIRPGVRKECHFGLKVPIFNSLDSINVAQAGAIIMGEFYRQCYYSSLL